MSAIMALPFMALGQTTEPQQQPQKEQTTQGQTAETQPAAPAKEKKERPAQDTAKTKVKAQTNANVRAETDVQRNEGRAEEGNRNKTEARSSTSQTNVNTNTNTKVNVEEFKSRHTEVFSLGRHPREFFVQRFGATHFRQIGQTYFVFTDGCWVAVDVDGFVYSERVICAGDPEFIAVD
jgi:predicted  nucleic acid-binding Zn-ribbon protein